MPTFYCKIARFGLKKMSYENTMLALRAVNSVGEPSARA
ncbi:MAG: hypothetical protein UV80_C0002G0118 [Candidatus Peregrinibacteria bacterium GW2011_GWF2_43_17]|nr:MAG: hypothetical protein UV80_C0002G0118 [Candidatus Peregrinibacteria bacterium GW2011_GWF2_43_17]KKT18533.1 MAG: hypothetical protein UW03_C0039G0006 [Candidatus Peregrinibacteria bacterium GW2011_GWA2_43_8]